MNKEDLIELRKKVSKLSEEEKIKRDLYLRLLSKGKIQGPLTGYASIDKPWLKQYSEKYILDSLPKMTAYDYLKECNKEYENNTALSYFGNKITFKELFENIDKTSKALLASGLNTGDIVTISMPNTPEAVYLFYACSKTGIIANMVDPRTSSEGIREYVEGISDKLIIIDNFYSKVKGLLEDNTINKIIAVSPSASLKKSLKILFNIKNKVDALKGNTNKIIYDNNTLSWEQFINNGENIVNEKYPEYEENSPLVIEHTGGTTGKPKGVVLSNDNINAVAKQSVMTGIDMQREHNWLDIMPTFIAYGVGMGLHLPLTIGMETILVPQFDAKKFDLLIDKYKPIHMVGVPSYWGTIIDSKKLSKQDLSYIIAPTVGGDSMDITLEKEANKYLKEHNCSSTITKGYGMTEVCGGVAGTVPDSNLIGSVGSPFVKTTIAIFDPLTEEELGYNKDGEICINTPNMMLGYYDNIEETNNVIKEHLDGMKWVHTGDIGHLDENGNLFIVDRVKRIIIRYDGFKVFPSYIEQVICSNKEVKEVKVVGINDINHSQGLLPKAHIVIKDEYKGFEEQIIEKIKRSCETELQEYAVPVEYEINNDLPLTSVGKIDYKKLEEQDRQKIKMLSKKI